MLLCIYTKLRFIKLNVCINVYASIGSLSQLGIDYNVSFMYLVDQWGWQINEVVTQYMHINILWKLAGVANYWGGTTGSLY